MEAKKKIFLSYCHKDDKWLKRMQVHLKVLNHSIKIDLWDDSRIKAGESWKKEIEDALNTCEIAILLVSADFLASRFITEIEVPTFLQRRSVEGIRIYPVIVSPCAWQTVPWLATLQCRPKDGKPISTWKTPDGPLSDVVREIHEIIQAPQVANTSAIEKKTERPSGKLIIRPTRKLFPNDNFLEFLQDPGANYTHRNKAKINLSDIYIVPKLKAGNTEKTGRELDIIEASSISASLQQMNKLLIISDEKGGKTSLAKYLYDEVLDVGAMPLYVSGEKVNIKQSTNLDKWLVERFCEQYSEDQVSLFEKASIADRVLILDDFDSCNVDEAFRESMLRDLSVKFGTVIVFADELFEFRGIAKPDVTNSFLLSFQQFDLLELDFSQREVLIKKWLSLGQDTIRDDDEEYTHRIVAIQNHIDTVTGKNLLPTFPFVVLTVLQTAEIEQPLKVESGAYGYLYQVLITRNLALVRSGPSIDAKYNFLSCIAFKLFKSKVKELNSTELKAIYDEFYSEYLITFDYQQMLHELLSVGVTIGNPNRSFGFRYPYYYYYFVAKYIADRLSVSQGSEIVKEAVVAMCNSLHIEEYANIMIMLCFLSRDSFVIDQMVAKAQGHYEDVKPCDLDEDVKTINELHKHLFQKMPPAEISSDTTERQVAINQRNGAELLPSKIDLPGEEEMSHFLKVNTALKTLQILGQTLRNFSGSLNAQNKIRIADECYRLGLRITAVLLTLYKSNLTSMQEFLAQSMRQQEMLRKLQFKEVHMHLDVADDQELLERVRARMLSVAHNTAYNMLKRISSAVGSEELKEIYDRVLLGAKPSSYVLVDHCIKLDHFRHPPFDDAMKTYSLMESNPFSANLLRSMVIHHLLLYPSRQQRRQQVCAAFDIKFKKTARLPMGDKGPVT